MNDYINRQVAIKEAEQMAEEHQYDFVGLLISLPSEDVAPVRRGHWETIDGWDGDEIYRCSECGAEFVLIDGTPKDNNYLYCPHCGARMDGEQNGI